MTTSMQEYPKTWKKTFISLWLGCFITGLGFSMTMPFMPLYMETIDHFSNAQLNFYSGLAFSVTYLAQAIVSPYWGSLADRKGRKLMCLRASGVMTFTIALVGLAHNVWTIIILRLIQGAFSGYINNATAFMAGETPRQHSGSVMSNMMTATVSGNLLGPIFGGALAGAFGYRIPFFITGFLMAIAFLLTLFNTKEHFTPVPKREMKPMKELFAQVPNLKLIIVMFISTMTINASLLSISPIVSLLVKQLMHGQGNVSLVSGIIAAAPGFGTLLVAKKVGDLIDKIGPQKVLTVGMIASVIIFIPMFFASSPLWLGILRFIFGIANAALMPAVQTVITVNVPPEAFGRIFSYNQSFQASGGVIGPLLGSSVSSIFGYQAVFLFTALFIGVDLCLVMWARKISDK